MYKEQNITRIEPTELLDKVQTLKNDGNRLVQICATKVSEGFELSYSFDKDLHLINLRMVVAEETDIPSITKIYWPAFIFENEMKDLFGVKMKHIELDYNGGFFRVSSKTPWNPKD